MSSCLDLITTNLYQAITAGQSPVSHLRQARSHVTQSRWSRAVANIDNHSKWTKCATIGPALSRDSRETIMRPGTRSDRSFSKLFYSASAKKNTCSSKLFIFCHLYFFSFSYHCSCIFNYIYRMSRNFLPSIFI